MTDPVADMLTRIRNAARARKDFTDMPASRIKLALAETLKKEGYIKGFDVREEPPRRILRVHVAYTEKREPVIAGIQRVSKPGLRVYVQKTDVPRVLGGLGVAIISTSQGVLTGMEARRRGLGGEVVCYVW